MKLYMIFGGEHYYPSGGIRDLIGVENDIDSAVKVLMEFTNEWEGIHWANIVDMDTLKIIKEFTYRKLVFDDTKSYEYYVRDVDPSEIDCYEVNHSFLCNLEAYKLAQFTSNPTTEKKVSRL